MKRTLEGLKAPAFVYGIGPWGFIVLSYAIALVYAWPNVH
jgi:hypothetical protein